MSAKIEFSLYLPEIRILNAELSGREIIITESFTVAIADEAAAMIIPAHNLWGV